MKILNSITIPFKEKNVEVDFGIAENEQEKNDMFKLRYKVYVEKKKYIPASFYKNDLEVDEYDKENKSIYFIAKDIEGKVIGTLRVINTDPLPTLKDYFKFEEPPEIKKLQPSQKIEIGRFISTGKAEEKYLPRHIIPIGLITAIVKAAPIYEWQGGYGSLKKNFYDKLRKIYFPLYLIKEHQLIFNAQESSDPLKNFFTEDDPVVPTYFIKDKVEKYFKYFYRKPFFKKVDDNKYEYQDKLINKLIFGKLKNN